MNRRLWLIIGLVLYNSICFAQDFKFFPDKFTRRVSSGQIAAGGTFPYLMIQTENDMWGDMTSDPFFDSKHQFKNVEDIVRVGIRHDTGVIIPAYKYQVSFEITCYDYHSPWSPVIKNTTLEFSYNPDSLTQYKDLVLYRFTGYHAIQVTITGIDDVTSGPPSSLVAAAIAKNFYVESEVSVHRYDLTPQFVVMGNNPSPDGKELKVFWEMFDVGSPVTCPLTTPGGGNDFKPAIYELEWCYIDDYQYDFSTNDSSYAFSTPGNINYDFRKNSTRVQISKGRSFSIPLIYEHGAIVYRVRAIRPDATRYKDIEIGGWTLSDYGTVDASASCFSKEGFLITDAHLHDSMNWQYTINFAEEGKYKHVINYFDGSLKDRQTQTKINTDNGYVIAVDKVYDYEGRPSLVSLPTPVYGQDNLQYRSDILLNTATGNPYKAADFDFIGCSRPDSIPYLSTSAQANIYYSPLNSDQADMQKFVPDAEGYPMVQTIYSPDNTNKVLWQGGAGQEQQIWKGHATQYEYSRPNQKEIDRYLGTEVGIAQFYPKQVVTDPNGQSSYSILDPSGKVVISGLQGPSPDSSQIPVDTLANFVRGKSECDDLLEGYTQENSGNSKKAQLPAYNDEYGDGTFKYSVRTFPFDTRCAGQYLWVPAAYTMKVTNDCGVIKNNTTGIAGEHKVTPSDGSAYEVSSQVVTGMSKGNYLVNKELSFSEKEVYNMVDSFVYANEPACYNDVHYFIKKTIDSTKFPCEGFVDTNTSHCDQMKKLMMAEMYPGAKYGKYFKDSSGAFAGGYDNSIFTTKVKPYLTTAPPKSVVKFLARTGCDPTLQDTLAHGSVDTAWKFSTNLIGPYVCSVFDPIRTRDSLTLYGGNITADNTLPAHYNLTAGYTIRHGMYSGAASWKTSVYIDSTVPLDMVYAYFMYDDEAENLIVNGVVNELDHGIYYYSHGYNYNVKGFHHGYNDITVTGYDWLAMPTGVTPEAFFVPAAYTPDGDRIFAMNAASLLGVIASYDTSGYRYRDSCIKLPDSVVKDGKVYKNLKNLPVEVLIEIFNDDIAEALLPLHPEYCKLLNCNDANFDQTLAETISFQQAENNNMFYLDSLIAHDPLVLLGGGLATAHRLKYMKGFLGKRIDSLAMEQTYCGAGNGEEYAYCVAKDYKYQIDNFIFASDDIRQTYFTNLKSLYIGNRALIKQGKLDSTTSSCVKCASNRMTQKGLPVFHTLDSMFNSVGMGSSSGGGDGDGDEQLPEWMREKFKKAKDNDSVGMSTVPGPLKDSMFVLDYDFAEIQAISVKKHLLNCTLDTAVQNRIYKATINVLMSGRKLTPAIMTSIITDTVSLAITDLCHPFLVAYDLIPDTREATTHYSCGTIELYEGLRDFLQRPQVTNELKNATTSLSGGTSVPGPYNVFESQFSSGPAINVSTYMDGTSLVCSTCYVNLIVSSNLKTDTFHISPANYGATPDIATFLSSVSPVNTIVNARCLNSLATAMATGVVAKNTAVIEAGQAFTSTSDAYFIWSHNTTFMEDAPSVTTLKNSVTCQDIKAALEDFNAEQSSYGYSEATNHPLYEYTVTNYLNFKLNKSYYFADYEKLMNGCAVTDKVLLKRLITTYRIEFSSDADATGFTTALHAYGEYKPDYLRYKLTSGNPVVFVNFSSLDNDTLLAYKQMIDGYTTGVVSRNYNYNPADANTNLLFASSSCSFNPSSYAPIYTTDDVAVWEDGAYNSAYKLHTFRLSFASPIQEADNQADIEKYLHDLTLVSSPMCNVGYSFYGQELFRSSDYATALKTEYLNFVYGLSGTHDAIIADIDPANLPANIPSYSGSIFTYDDPYCRGSRTNVYAFKTAPSPLPQGMDSIRNKILANVGSVLFPNQDFTYVSGMGSRLAVIRKANGDYWYRYFDLGNHLYNIFITPPSRSLGIPWENFTFSLSDLEAGPHPNTFVVEVTSGSHTVRCNGYAEFMVSDRSVVAENVILDKDPKGVYCFDSLDCEHDLLARAIRNGQASYRRHFDSTVKQISGDMMTHLMTTTKDSLVFCGQRQQYQQTLYYYDLAGNLTSTVPPAGIETVPDNRLNEVKINRSISAPETAMTTHKKTSVYRYNSLNQLEYQHTPDGGTTVFFYDAAGRQIFSQSSRQRPFGTYSYSIYDAQGRPEESGEFQAGCTYTPDPLVDFDTTACTLGSVTAAHPPFIRYSFNDMVYHYDTLKSMIRAKDRTEVVRTSYDEAPIDLSTIISYLLKAQENLRNRVAAIQYYDNIESYLTNPSLPGPTFATYYSYDIGGNVKNIVYDYPYLGRFQQQFKSIDYDFDLISGKVNMLSYNPGYPDQFYQQYEYDADNRITKVLTSNDGLIWNNDAQYEYYKHGPLARLKLGEHQVQSLEYAYTIQGWLKAINGDLLNPDLEMGSNGRSGDMTFSRDVIAHALRYFEKDYKSISSTAVTNLTASTAKNLYNGNITQQTTGIGGLGNMQRVYQYDQLQRLKMTGNVTVDDYTPALASTPADLFKSTYAYDMDGNISALQRWDGTSGSPVQIDNFSYTYDPATPNNRLTQVRDLAAPTAGTDLQPGQVSDNYVYDPSGNLVEDKQAQSIIAWDRFGKVKSIHQNATSQAIKFKYDGKGNRIWKDVINPDLAIIMDPPEVHQAEYYVRDAGGNILATYHTWFKDQPSGPLSYALPGDTFSLAEHHIYGSSRLGVHRYDSTSLSNRIMPLPGEAPQTVLNTQVQWYSYAYTDMIDIGYTEPYGTAGNTFLGDLTTSRTLGRRYYELTDHLGNVLATVLDRKTGAGTLSGSSGTLYDHWSADLASTADYYPGGMMMPGRNTEHSWSRMGYNGQAKDDEVYGKGNLNTALFWEMDTRILRRWNFDPVLKPWESSYAVFANSPIVMVDPLGNTSFYNTSGVFIGSDWINNNIKLMAVNEATVKNIIANTQLSILGLPVVRYNEQNKSQFDLFPVVSESEIEGMEKVYDVSFSKSTENGMVGGANNSGGRSAKVNVMGSLNASFNGTELTRSFYKSERRPTEYDGHSHPPIFRYLGDDKFSISSFTSSLADRDGGFGTSGLGVVFGWQTNKDISNLPPEFERQARSSSGKWFKLPDNMIGDRMINFYNSKKDVGSFKFSDFKKAQENARNNF
ncbi:MAG: hypothetical protein WC716_15880 [Chitinophagaceae bacterium]